MLLCGQVSAEERAPTASPGGPRVRPAGWYCKRDLPGDWAARVLLAARAGPAGGEEEMPPRGPLFTSRFRRPIWAEQNVTRPCVMICSAGNPLQKWSTNGGPRLPMFLGPERGRRSLLSLSSLSSLSPLSPLPPLPPLPAPPPATTTSSSPHRLVVCLRHEPRCAADVARNVCTARTPAPHESSEGAQERAPKGHSGFNEGQESRSMSTSEHHVCALGGRSHSRKHLGKLHIASGEREG